MLIACSADGGFDAAVLDGFMCCVLLCAECEAERMHLPKLINAIPTTHAAVESFGRVLSVLVRDSKMNALQGVIAATRAGKATEFRHAFLTAVRLSCRLGATDAVRLLVAGVPGLLHAAAPSGPPSTPPVHGNGTSVLGIALFNSHAAVIKQLMCTDTSCTPGQPAVECQFEWATLRLPRRQPGAGGASEAPALACVALILAAAEPLVHQYAQYSPGVFGDFAPPLPQRASEVAGKPPSSICSLHRWHASSHGSMHAGQSRFMHVQMLRGFDAPTALFWATACSGYIRELARCRRKGLQGALAATTTRGILALYASIARLHPCKVAQFGEAARLAAQLGIWTSRRAVVLNRSAARANRK